VQSLKCSLACHARIFKPFPFGQSSSVSPPAKRARLEDFSTILRRADSVDEKMSNSNGAGNEVNNHVRRKLLEDDEESHELPKDKIINDWYAKSS